MIINSHSFGKKTFCFFTIVFGFFLCFFTFFHPLVLTTPDDWYYISYTRDAIPLLVHHNPTRILPEILMPLVATISSICLRPFCTDFSLSIAYGSGFVLACLITTYSYNFYALIKSRYSLSSSPSLCLSAIFLLLHFLILRKENIDNPYLFGAFCLTNIYYYTVGILMNASLVMYCIRTKLLYRLSNLNYWQLGMLSMLVYLCLLSNLYSSIILATYFGTHILYFLFNNKYNVKRCISENKYVLCSLVGFCIILILEANGGNAKTITSQDESFFVELRKTIGFYHSLFNQINYCFKILALLVVIIAIYIAIRIKNKSILRDSAYVFFNFCIVNLFSLLISAKAYPHYVAQEDKAFMELYWVIVAIVCSICFCVKKKPVLTSILPILFLVLLFQTNTKTRTFREVFGFYTMSAAFDDMIDCMSQANEQGVDSITLYVPYVDAKPDNWPFPLTQGKELSNMFYSHRIINKRIVISMKAVSGINTFKSSLNGFTPDSILSNNSDYTKLNYYRK